ncbi:hypothetical protein [Kribbella sp. NPDC049584]|uniref:hypothetical protein n=1 Tax=Kribbella sp. NPDC049584 TaxID=3154833 RepID=UPI00344207E9
MAVGLGKHLARNVHVDYFVNGQSQMQTFYLTNGKESQSMDLPLDITEFRVCGRNTFNDGDICSAGGIFSHPAR